MSEKMNARTANNDNLMARTPLKILRQQINA